MKLIGAPEGESLLRRGGQKRPLDLGVDDQLAAGE